ncbi:MAG: drug/metabolite exporter YedA [Polyangiales bacterium]
MSVVSAAEPRASAPRWVGLSLLTLYLVWGSTYLGMRVALESFPPFLLGGLRYGLAGALLYGWALARGASIPTPRQWGNALLVGTLLFAGGNGLVAFAERTISSGVAAIVVATVSLWSVLFARLWGARPSAGELFGLGLGLGGVLLLQRGGAFGSDVPSIVGLLLAPVCWAFGSQWGARANMARGPVGTAAQMLMGGASMLAIGLVSGERLRPLTPAAAWAFVHLVTLGSLVAFSAYQYLLANTRPALATSYAFVNPAVALLLGAALVGEPLDAARLGACAITALAVVFVVRAQTRKLARP